MRFSHFFIDRPIFAMVISVFITLIGVFAYPLLPLAQYPEIAPPTVAVSAAYPGASAEDAALQVAAPLEQEINGVEGMIYMQSSSTSDGTVQITVTFEPGTDLDAAQVLVQNRVNRAEPRLPATVRQAGVSVEKQSTGFLMIVALVSDDPSLDVDYVGNFANSQLRDRLLRLEGVGGVQIFGGGNYAMRVWVDPEKPAARGLNASDITDALAAQNVQAAAGSVGGPPFDSDPAAFQIGVQVEGRLTDPEEFANIVIKRGENGEITRLGDVARVELGSQDYGIRGYFDGQRGVAMAIIQQPGANALGTAERVLTEMEDAKSSFPPGVRYLIPYNPTEFVAASVEAVQHTLLEAVVIVAIVVLVFLQTWRAAIIPLVAIPISLIGVFAVQLALGFSINSLSLFALVLAVGIVVDDAIVVVENVERNIGEGRTPREAARRSMDEVSGALIAIGLVLISVFIPTAFTPGIPGIFYRQFAVAIASASVISLLVSLTLSPALAAFFLKPHRAHDGGGPRFLAPLRYGANKFNQGFDWLATNYGRLTARLVRMVIIMLVIYAALLGLTGWRLTATPTGFIPQQDQGILIGVVQLPPGASLERTNEVMLRARQMIIEQEGIAEATAFAGLDGSSFSAASNAGTMFIRLTDFEEREGVEGLTAAELSGKLSGLLGGAISEGSAFIIAPPAVQGLGNGSGFTMMIQAGEGQSYQELQGAAYAMMGAAQQNPAVNQVFTLFNTSTPRVQVDVDRIQALRQGVQPSEVFNTLGVYLGSRYVNDFNFLGRTFRVVAQADAPFRDSVADIGNLKIRSASGEMVPINSIAQVENRSGPTRVVRYNLLPAVELQGQAAPGYSSGEALTSMEQMAAEVLPPGFSYEWTTLAYQQKQASGSSAFVFGLAVLFVFLVLAANYEAFTLPLAVIFIVPMCVLAAIIGVNLAGIDNNILVQVGLIVLIALAAKNAILIVEFAKQAEEERGMSPREAAVDAARTRLRPILMTSFAFIFGVLPLAIATGPGAEMRQAIGVAVFSGMIGVTVFGLIFTPVFYVLFRWISGLLPKPPEREREFPTAYGPTAHDRFDRNGDEEDEGGPPAPAR